MKIAIKLPGLDLKNPIIPASGTFGFGEEFAQLYDLNILGSLVVKAITKEPREGNESPRIAEVYGGMLNAIGLQNPGLEVGIEKIQALKKYDIPIIANVAGSTIEEYIFLVQELSKLDNIGALELNVSCPNVKTGGIAFGTTPRSIYSITSKVREHTKKPLYIKLSPNVSDIIEIAKAAEAGGADGISMINTLLGMKIDLKTGQPLLANKTGGFSGPAIKPIAIRMIYQIYNHVRIPIIGMGGIMDAEDVLEFLFAGASAVQVGTGNLINPYICKEIIEDLPNVLRKYGFNNINDCIGYAHNKR